MTIREKLNQALLDFRDINLDSEAAREALIDRIIKTIQGEPIDRKYWKINCPEHMMIDEKGRIWRDDVEEHPLAQFDAIVDDDGNVIRRETGEIPHPD